MNTSSTNQELSVTRWVLVGFTLLLLLILGLNLLARSSSASAEANNPETTGSQFEPNSIELQSGGDGLSSPVQVRCLHSPIWPNADDPITFFIEAVNPQSIESNQRIRLSVTNITDGDAAPIVGPRCEGKTPRCDNSSADTKPAFDEGLMKYTCRIEIIEEVIIGRKKTLKSVFEEEFTHTVQIGHGFEGIAVPILYTGQSNDPLNEVNQGNAIDIVFIRDRESYSSIQDEDLLTGIHEVIRNSFYSQPIFLENQDRLNFWLAKDDGVAHSFDKERCLNNPEAEEACIHEVPENWSEDDGYGFADVGIILHTHSPFTDAAHPSLRIFSANPETASRVVPYQTGHVLFGLADEYKPKGGYFQLPLDEFPNLYDDPDTCAQAQIERGISSDAATTCDPVEEPWHRIDIADIEEDALGTGEHYQTADNQRIDWLFDRCHEDECAEPAISGPLIFKD